MAYKNIAKRLIGFPVNLILHALQSKAREKRGMCRVWCDRAFWL